MSVINAKPAAGLLGGALTTVVLGLIARHTGYDPSVEEATGITTVVVFLLAWLVPENIWDRYSGADPGALDGDDTMVTGLPDGELPA